MTTKDTTMKISGLLGGTKYLLAIGVIAGLDTVSCTSSSFTTRNHKASVEIPAVSGSVNDEVMVVASGSDAEGIARWEWDRDGDGNVDTITTLGQVRVKAPEDTGVHEFTVWVVDGLEERTEAKGTITVTNEAPVVDLVADTIEAKYLGTVDVGANATDDGIQLTIECR